MSVYHVGSLYHPGRTTWPETVDFNWRAGGPEVRLFLGNPSAAEIEGIRKGRAEFALYVEAPAVFLLYRFVPGMPTWSDSPFAYHLVERVFPEEASIPDILPTSETRDLLSIILVNAFSGRILALREVSFSPDFSRALRRAVRDTSALEWPGDKTYERLIQRVYAKFPTSTAMAAAAITRCTGGE